MWYQIFKFELKYRLSRPATFIYFVLLVLAALGMASPNVIEIFAGGSQIMHNAPVVIARILVFLTLLAIPVCSSVMGVAVVRDFEHRMESLIFTTPVSKFSYLTGRFTGSFLVLLFIVSGLVAGFMAGSFIPWAEEEKLLSFNLWHYLNPFLCLSLPVIFLCSAAFFTGGALSRNMLMVYTQGIIFLALYFIARGLFSDLELKEWGGVIDIFGLTAMRNATEYWTPAQINTRLIPLEGILLYNKVFLVISGIIALAVCYPGFKFNVAPNQSRLFKKSKSNKEKADVNPATATKIPQLSPDNSFAAGFKKVVRMSFFYFKSTLKEVPFLAIVFPAILMLVVVLLTGNKIDGTAVYPTTYSVLESIKSLMFFLIVIVVYYSGEIIWRERDIKMDLVHEALPVSDLGGILGKFFGMTLIYSFLLFIFLLSGILFQTFKGYYNYQLTQYFTSLFVDSLTYLLIYTCLAFFIHTLVNNKFMGHTLLIGIIVALIVAEAMGPEHNLLVFGGSTTGLYSDMNGYGHSIIPFTWYRIYWMFFALLLLSMATLLKQRGIEKSLFIRISTAKQRLSRPVVIFMTTIFVLFTLTGSFIFYNTNILNEYISSDQQKELQAQYEKELSRFEQIPQLKIQDVKLHTELYSATRSFTARGFYVLENKNKEAIKEIHINLAAENTFTYPEISFSRAYKIKKNYEKQGYRIYELNEAVEPGDTLKMEFEMAYRSRGFTEGNPNNYLVYNGTFLNNSFFPSLGYNSGAEIISAKDRKKYGLPPKERMKDIHDKKAATVNLFGDDADKINFEMVIGTEKEQTAVAPGNLINEWQTAGRRYFHYKMDQPMVNFYSIVSARYEVKKDSLNGISLEIYYHKDHDRNLDRMMQGMKDALVYYSKNFGPYQYKQLRIMEFPRYSTFAQSFANTIPFSEGYGFVLDVQKGDVDVLYNVTAHEVAHQWWGHQVTEADVQGRAMLSETLSEYAALMVMKQRYGQEEVLKFTDHALNTYLKGRASEPEKEMPLSLVEDQPYIHYQKGLLAMYALQDYISEEKVNAALKEYVSDWKDRQNPYPTSRELISYFRKATPDSMQYIITDLFENITLYRNKVVKAESEKLADGRHRVKIQLSCQKVISDGSGVETQVPLKDWIDIGVYGKDAEGKEILLYLKKHQIKQNNQTIEVETEGEPVKAGIDPLHKLTDLKVKDNVINTEQI